MHVLENWMIAPPQPVFEPTCSDDLAHMTVFVILAFDGRSISILDALAATLVQQILEKGERAAHIVLETSACEMNVQSFRS